LGGVDIQKIKDSKTNITIEQESFTGEKTSKIDNILKLAFGGISGYLLFMFIIIYGNMIMRSVIEEKTSRIIEVIISSVKPIQLMMGKIIGTSLAGITQFAIWVILGSVAMTIISAIFGINLTEMQTPQQELVQQAMQNPEAQDQIQLAMTAFYNLPIANLIIAFLLFFIGGYLLYSSLYAAIGAAVDNETDTQQFMMPILMPLILAVYVGVFTVISIYITRCNAHAYPVWRTNLAAIIIISYSYRNIYVYSVVCSKNLSGWYFNVWQKT